MARTRHMALCAAAIAIISCVTGPAARAQVPDTRVAKAMAQAKPEPERAPAQVPEARQAKTDSGKTPGREKCDAACEKRNSSFYEFTISVYEGDLKDVKRMLGMRLVSLQGAFGMEALSDAKSPGMLKLLIRHGADANSTNSNGETALMMAAFDGDYQKAAALIRAGADARMRNTKADTSAISYCTSGKIAGLLIANGADVNERNVYGTTPLIYAASRGCNDVAKVLLDNGADANANSPVAGTALMLAAYFNNAGLVDLLLSRGADVNAAGTDYFDGKKGKKTALRLAKENNLSDIVKILERHGARM